jgi:hypothetical protein
MDTELSAANSNIDVENAELSAVIEPEERLLKV